MKITNLIATIYQLDLDIINLDKVSSLVEAVEDLEGVGRLRFNLRYNSSKNRVGALTMVVTLLAGSIKREEYLREEIIKILGNER